MKDTEKPLESGELWGFRLRRDLVRGETIMPNLWDSLQKLAGVAGGHSRLHVPRFQKLPSNCFLIGCWMNSACEGLEKQLQCGLEGGMLLHTS